MQRPAKVLRSPLGLLHPTATTKLRPPTQASELFAHPGVTVLPDFDALIDRDTAAYAAKVKPSSITSWVSRGWKDPETGERRKLERRAVDSVGRHLDRYGDVVAAERATRGRGKARDWSLLDVNSAGMPHAC